MSYDVYGASDSGTETTMVQDFVRTNTPQNDFTPSWTLVVTWYKVLPLKAAEYKAKTQVC